MMTAGKTRPGFPLNTLLEGMTDAAIDGNVSVRGLSSDSRTVKPGDLFLACRGPDTHGGLFIRDAIKAGAEAVVVDETLMSDLDRRRPGIFPAPDLAEKLGLIAGRFYGNPSAGLHLAGITGTNGKTSVAYWLAQVCSPLADRRAGLIGSLGYGRYPSLQSGVNTTPGAIILQRLLADFVDSGADTAFMEVSSHALDQGRVNGVEFDTAVFTNLSRDHLDYHEDMDAYFDAKLKLFACSSLRAAVINYDDDHGRQLIDRLPARVEAIGYSISGKRRPSSAAGHPVVRAGLTITPQGTLCLDIVSPWGGGRVRTGVTGRFNAGNLLAVISVLCLAGFSLDDILEQLDGIAPTPGRMEVFNRDDGARLIVDYAHSPAALEQVLRSLRETCDGRLICVFGCGGERDKAKRAQMGEVASDLSDEVIVTDDNPRHEDAQDIIDAILSGIGDRRCAAVERDRAKAIELALGRAGRDDTVLIAGKGHETFQEIAGVRYPFNDRQQVRRLLGNAG